MKEAPEVTKGKVLAILAYLSIFCFAPLLMNRSNKFVLFHAKQGLVLFVAELALCLISIVPIIGWAIWFLGILACGVLSLAGIIHVIAGNCWSMPLVSAYAEKIKL